MPSKKEKKPFVIEFKSNYGTTSSQGGGQSTIYCLHGQPQVQIRGHCHRQRSEGVDLKARKKLIIASVLCLFFMVAEIVGGILSNSLAIATDAAHLLTDFASFMISLFAIWLAGRPSTQRMSFGWYRAEVIGALASVVMIWVITAILVWLAVQRIIHQDYDLNAGIMLITSVLAIIVNLIMGFQLHSHGHSHSHDSKSSPPHSPPVITVQRPTSPTAEQPSKPVANGDESSPVPGATESNNGQTVDGLAYQGSTEVDLPAKKFGAAAFEDGRGDGHVAAIESIKIGGLGDQMKTTKPDLDVSNHSHPENMNVRAAFIHVLGDVLQSIGVFVAALVIYFKPEWAIADPICTFVFSVIVLCTTFSIMKDALLVLMEGTPSYLHYAEVMGVFLQIEGVERVHNLRIWALSINKIALSAHLAIRPGANASKILQEATTAVHLKYSFFETTLQIEDFTPEMEDCQQCIIPDS